MSPPTRDLFITLGKVFCTELLFYSIINISAPKQTVSHRQPTASSLHTRAINVSLVKLVPAFFQPLNEARAGKL